MLDEATEAIGTEPVVPENIEVQTNNTEETLSAEITHLWAAHTDTQSAVKKTQQELKVIRQNLGERLYFMKEILARPGRAGQWSSFLNQHGISRTTADRLAASHAKTLNPDESCTSGALPSLTDEEIAELAKGVWKKSKKKLGTTHAAYAFLGRLVAESGLANFKFTRGDQRGIAVVDPEATSTSQATTATTDASDAAPTNAV